MNANKSGVDFGVTAIGLSRPRSKENLPLLHIGKFFSCNPYQDAPRFGSSTHHISYDGEMFNLSEKEEE